MNSKPTKSPIVARLTAIRTVGVKTIIEIHADATFSNFYKWYVQGNRRSTKTFIRTANRNESLPYINAHLHTPGLEAVKSRLESMKQFTSVSIRIYRKRDYRKLITAAPDQLGLTKVSSTFGKVPGAQRVGSQPNPIALPIGYLTIKRRVDILLGRS